MSAGQTGYERTQYAVYCCYSELSGGLMRARELADQAVRAVQAGNADSLARAAASDLASTLSGLAEYCRQNAYTIGMLDLSIEGEIVQDVRSALKGATGLAGMPEIDYDLDRARLEARRLMTALIGTLRSPGGTVRFREAAGRSSIDGPSQDDLQHEPAPTPSARIARPAAGLLSAVSRLLPQSDRERYAAEYASELWELAHAGAARRHQLGYAARQTLRAGCLRSEVLAPRRKKASQ